LNNEKLRDVIETMTSTAVLILGNFAPGRKEVLEAIWERLRERG
jgi:phage/plasmid-associated DNA primase